MNFKLYSAILAFFTFSAIVSNAQCPVSSLSVYNLAADSVTISWVGNLSVPGYEYAVLPATVPTPTSATTTSGGTTVRVGGLNIGTAYKAWLRSDCGGGIYTPWVALSFSTPCGLPGTVSAGNIAADSAVVSWSSVSPTAQYEYVIDTASAVPTGAGTSINTNTVTKKGLLPAKLYYVYVRTACSSVFSPWSAAATFFSAFPTGITTSTQVHTTVYPNPVIDKLYIKGLPANTTVSVVNTLGIILYRQQANDGQLTIDIQQYPQGIYILRYTDGTILNTIKIEKR